jgi:hypothetical protein
VGSPPPLFFPSSSLSFFIFFYLGGGGLGGCNHLVCNLCVCVLCVIFLKMHSSIRPLAKFGYKHGKKIKKFMHLSHLFITCYNLKEILNKFSK